MTKEEQQTIFKWLCESLPYGVIDLKINVDKPSWLLSKGTIIKLRPHNISDIDVEKFIPIAKPLSMLTEPIKVEGYNEGKEFHPFDELLATDYADLEFFENDFINRIPKGDSDLLIKWGFFPYDQTYFKKGYLIKESEL